MPTNATNTNRRGRQPIEWSTHKTEYAKEYASTHTQKETALHFGVSVSVLRRLVGNTTTFGGILGRVPQDPAILEPTIQKVLGIYNEEKCGLLKAIDKSGYEGSNKHTLHAKIRKHADYVPQTRGVTSAAVKDPVLFDSVVNDVLEHYLSTRCTMNQALNAVDLCGISSQAVKAAAVVQPSYKPNARGKVGVIHIPTAELLLHVGYNQSAVARLFGVSRQALEQHLHRSNGQQQRASHIVADNLNVKHDAIIEAHYNMIEAS
tara:strand:+ start:740 stop:1525 length:786 start_codon:yes stop_codon:yes gene_type:complete